MDRPRGALSKLGVAVIAVMEAFKAREFSLQVNQASKSLGAQEELVIDIVELLDGAITPGFALRDEEQLHTQVQAQADKKAEASGVAVGASKRQFVVDLQGAGDSQALPSSDNGLHDVDVVFAGQSLEGHSVAKDIDEMGPVEALFASQVAGTDQVELVDIVGLSCLHGWVRDSAWTVDGAVHQALLLEDTIDGPDLGQRVNAQFFELPLDGERSLLGIFGFEQSFAHCTDGLCNRLGSLVRDLVRGSGSTVSPVEIAWVVAFEPLVEPASGSAAGLTNNASWFALKETCDRIDSSLLFCHGLPSFAEGEYP